MKLDWSTLSIVAIFAMSLGSLSHADIIFDSSFTAAQGYSDGAAQGQPGFTAPAATQAGIVISNSAGVGHIGATAGAFLRAHFGEDDLTDPNDSFSGTTSMNVGDMILVEAIGLTINSDPSNQTMVLGIANNINPASAGGSNQLAIGSQMTTDGTSLFVENRAFGVDVGGRVDTTFDQGQTFNYAVKMTAEGNGDLDSISYTIDHLINGSSILTEFGQTGNFTPANRDTSGFIQDQGGTNWMADGLKLSIVTAPIPEPTTAMTFGVVGMVMLSRRRRGT